MDIFSAVFSQITLIIPTPYVVTHVAKLLCILATRRWRPLSVVYPLERCWSRVGSHVRRLMNLFYWSLRTSRVLRINSTECQLRIIRREVGVRAGGPGLGQPVLRTLP